MLSVKFWEIFFTIGTLLILLNLTFLHGATTEKEVVTLERCQTASEWFPTTYQRHKRSSPLTASSEDDSLAGENQENKYFRPEGQGEHKWPGGVVHYKISTASDTGLFDNHIAVFRQAIDEYHNKTCVRFEAVGDNTAATRFVNIQRWISHDLRNCGRAAVCLRTLGPQVAKFTDWCMNKQTMVHELGHTLCLSHEHLRNDRDDFVNFEECDLNLEKEDSDTNHGIYDYASQMHYKCECDDKGGKSKNPHWQLCGDAIPGNVGLSVMDADTLNDMYSCQGCYRHRWRPIATINEAHLPGMYSFGHVNSEGHHIYPCRALHKGEVAVGMFTFESKGCLIPSRFDNASKLVTDQAEVLTIPGGLSANTGEDDDEEALFQYQLVNILSESKEDIVRSAVRAGNGFSVGGGEPLKFANSFIAFAALTLAEFEVDVESPSPLYAPAKEVIGSVWDWKSDNELQSVFTTGKGNIVQVKNFKILVCK